LVSANATLKFPRKATGRRWKAPSHLAPATRKWFARVVRDYQLEEHHVRILTVAGESWDRLQGARTIIDREGLTYLDRFKQPRVRPEVGIERDARIAFCRCLRELALDVSEPDDSRPPSLGSGRRRS